MLFFSPRIQFMSSLLESRTAHRHTRILSSRNSPFPMPEPFPTFSFPNESHPPWLPDLRILFLTGISPPSNGYPYPRKALQAKLGRASCCTGCLPHRVFLSSHGISMPLTLFLSNAPNSSSSIYSRTRECLTSSFSKKSSPTSVPLS